LYIEFVRFLKNKNGNMATSGKMSENITLYQAINEIAKLLYLILQSYECDILSINSVLFFIFECANPKIYKIISFKCILIVDSY
jgi:hypothetical protein